MIRLNHRVIMEALVRQVVNGPRLGVADLSVTGKHAWITGMLNKI